MEHSRSERQGQIGGRSKLGLAAHSARPPAEQARQAKLPSGTSRAQNQLQEWVPKYSPRGKYSLWSAFAGPGPGPAEGSAGRGRPSGSLVCAKELSALRVPNKVRRKKEGKGSNLEINRLFYNFGLSFSSVWERCKSLRPRESHSRFCYAA